MADHVRAWQEGQRLHINDLPDEMIQAITKYLPIGDRKNLSMVSSLWNGHAFSDANMDYVRLRIKGSAHEHRHRPSLYRSERRYRHLVYSSRNPLNEIDFDMTMYTLMVLGSEIQSFVLLNRCTLGQLKELVDLLPNLQMLSLNVVSVGNSLVEFPAMQQLRELRMNNNTLLEAWLTSSLANSNIRKLYVNLTGRREGEDQFLNFIAQHQKQLEWFGLLAPEHLKISYNKLNLRQLHTLDLSEAQCERDEEELITFFKNLPILQVAMLHFDVTTAVLKVICNHCACLYKLRFKVDALGSECFRFLRRLIHLRDLIIDGEIRHDMIEACPPLNGVKFLSLTKNPLSFGATMGQLTRLFPRLRILKVDLTQELEMSNQFISGIGQHFSQITCLFIESEVSCNDLTTSTMTHFVEPLIFSHLRRLTNLQELTLSCVRFVARYCPPSKDNCLFVNFQKMCNGDWNEQPRENLRRLKLKNCHWVTGNTLKYVLTVFTSIQYLEVSKCRMITPEDIDEFRTVLPKCIVYYVR
ncbi:uncharacterized protein LOC109397722 [Aedes albopictus]|uniref:F-box domain-containing protein n=1 Tax=Aedes albopictus TaxID=7160 RepID=A0ABM1YGL2_AEDAL|nr:uncharacterized protein LOC109397722 isoform X2 [Aedes albopictus]XP_029714322.1 uncharacterized protein LOC109397722 isoform X2 [Aedes albopictus]